MHRYAICGTSELPIFMAELDNLCPVTSHLVGSNTAMFLQTLNIV